MSNYPKLPKRQDVLAKVLEGRYVRLEPLEERHFDGLKALVNDQGGLIFKNTPLGASFEDYFEKALAVRSPNSHVPFVLRQKSDESYIGMSRMFDIIPQHRSLEIGYTWYHPDFWGGQVNPDAKLALMSYAFEHCAYNRVALLTDEINKHSQAGITKLGAKREGIIRNHRIMDDGRIRNSVMFSVIRDEWPVVKAGLEARLRDCR